MLQTDIQEGELMKRNNICKFPSSTALGGAISVSRFVKETDSEVMMSKNRLYSHRMLLVTEGNGQFLINGDLHSVEQGTLLFIFADDEFCLFSGSLVYIYIDYTGARADELHRRFEITPLTRAHNGFDGLIPLWQESLARASDKTIDLASESILLYSFSRLSDTVSEKNGIIGRIAEITEQDFGDPDLTLSKIAESLCYHPKYLSHLFKEKMSMSYSEYLRSVRLKYAVTLFDHGIDSIKNVALLSGFSDPLYFSKVFKDTVGVSPTVYVKNKIGDNK